MMESIFVADKSLQELECLYSCSVNDDDYYMILAYNIALKSPKWLRDRIHLYEDGRLRGALFGLGMSNDSDSNIDGILESYLGSANDLAIAEAIDALARRKVGRSISTVTLLSKHASPYVRGAVLRYLRSLQGKSSVRALIAALSDSHSVVRQSAIDELAESGEVESVEYLQPLPKDSNEDVRAAARSAIEQLQSKQV
jgi:hypothetical protein